MSTALQPEWLEAMAGGGLIGLAASIMMLGSGRIAGISGIFSGLLTPRAGDTAWRGAFVAGLLIAGLLATILAPEAIDGPDGRSLRQIAAAGLAVGFGVRLGNGCTSGHGVCGLSRLSVRSVVATITFMTTGMVAATLARLGGAM